jgi:ribosome biogenesis protein NSA1
MQPSLWDLATGSRVWQGKGGKPNRVGLVDKPYPTAVAFLPSSKAFAANGTAAAGTAAEGGDSSSISRRFVVGSATAKVHVYDTAAGKRPQQEAVFGESRITALEVPPSGEQHPCGNCIRSLQALCLCSICPNQLPACFMCIRVYCLRSRMCDCTKGCTHYITTGTLCW